MSKSYQKKWYQKNKKKIRLAYLKRTSHTVLANKKLRAEKRKAKEDIIIQNRKRKDQRNRNIVKDYVSGMFCSEICEKYNVTNERCRQIIIKYTGNKYEAYKEKTRHMKYGVAKEEMFKKLISVSEKLGRIPQYEELKKYGMRTIFYNELRPKLIALGYKSTTESKKEKTLNQIVKLAVELKRIPTAYDLQKVAKLHYRYYFGSIENIQQLVANILNKK